ncbi:DMT family transporter [Paralimibaculum aggregatum]|uniref:DMT family transporter n=1 Tax=Paralimibaculum aggregatum TaxID=3036245 RepID=A0ABQ6LQE7_9RHOB|nr:DMT family transporter [Limibaculum sp. NKW23]GMG83728.1 DMT family transporter [Limibaculum sp. NKW23]
MPDPLDPRALPRAPATTGATRSDLHGILWMLISCALLSGVAALGRHAALAGVPLLQIVFLRLAFAVLAMAPILAHRGRGMLRTPHLRLYTLRVAMGLVAMTSWFAAISLAPIGEATAIAFLMPLLATMGAALFLGETVGWRRWGAIVVGFLGALVILRPGIAEASPGALIAVFSALAMAAASLMIKQLADRDHPDTVVLITLLMQTVVMLLPGLWVWQPLTAELWLVMACMGLFGMLGHITLARALRAADASVVMGIDFARLPFAVLFGWLLFGELIDIWTWIGAGIIFGSAFYTARRERRLAQSSGSESVQPAAPVASSKPPDPP